MKYQDEYRSKDVVLPLAEKLHRLCANTPEMTFMEVCGTHTMSIAQHGLRTLLPPQVKLVSGPGCPVCVTPQSFIDRAIALSRLPGTIITTFGDMVRVPGSNSSLLEEQARGSNIHIVYSPLDAVTLAARQPNMNIIFLGIGFETTAPTIAAAILTANEQNLRNFFVLAAHKTMPKPMELLAADPALPIEGFICPAHVSAIIGAKAYEALAKAGKACVVTGFEPADILQGIEMLVRQIVARNPQVEIQYRRVVTWEGNRKAQGILEKVFVPCDAEWRGLGVIPGSGLSMRSKFSRFDAEKMIPVEVEEPREHQGCLCGLVLKGITSPPQCPLFGTSCNPESPVGACMVSSEGACATAYRYGA